MLFGGRGKDFGSPNLGRQIDGRVFSVFGLMVCILIFGGISGGNFISFKYSFYG
jgi:hypothetical protein